ncbi:MAG: DUF1294 domain-containing protein [Clostridia bacterium]|nr:DUF1294 domain-containing protein [Clostridia bacterium]
MPYAIQLTIAIILIAMNLITFIVYVIDKLLAKHQKSRIPEKILLLLAFAFGSVGAITSMQLFRHKTDAQKDKTKLAFTVGVPISLICQIAICVLWSPYHSRWEYIVGAALYVAAFGAWAVFWKSSKARNRGA